MGRLILYITFNVDFFIIRKNYITLVESESFIFINGGDTTGNFFSNVEGQFSQQQATKWAKIKSPFRHFLETGSSSVIKETILRKLLGRGVVASRSCPKCFAMHHHGLRLVTDCYWLLFLWILFTRCCCTAPLLLRGKHLESSNKRTDTRWDVLWISESALLHWQLTNMGHSCFPSSNVDKNRSIHKLWALVPPQNKLI